MKKSPYHQDPIREAEEKFAIEKALFIQSTVEAHTPAWINKLARRPTYWGKWVIMLVVFFGGWRVEQAQDTELLGGKKGFRPDAGYRVSSVRVKVIRRNKVMAERAFNIGVIIK